VKLPLTKFLTSTGERRVRVEEAGGQTAKTVFYRRQVWPDTDPAMSLLEAELFTGRTHQIRVHLTHLGFALAGDEKYGDFAWNKVLSKQGLKRMFLHARRLVFVHPLQEREVEIESALPPELSRFLETLDAARPGDA
jgi:23S rRNA pseudouridine955/2504/2580 synthase